MCKTTQAVLLFLTFFLAAPIVAQAAPNGRPFLNLQEQLDEVQVSVQGLTQQLEVYRAQAEAQIALAEGQIVQLENQLDAEKAARLIAEGQLLALIDQEMADRQAADAIMLAELGDVSIPEPLSALADFVFVEYDGINGLAGPHIIFEGANLHIRSGHGSTSDGGSLSGLGNLIVGYNEPREYVTEQILKNINGLLATCAPYNTVFDPYDFAAVNTFPLGGADPCGGALISRRIGSHNLIVGDYHNYNSYGGIIGGVLNATDEHAVGASILGGMSNLVTHPFASIVGGSSNVASANRSAIVGGMWNRTFSWWQSAKPRAPVAAGETFGGAGYNTVAVGGWRNQISNRTNVIVGGDGNNVLTAANAVILGGYENYLRQSSCGGSCDETVILGGRQGTATGGLQIQPLEAITEGLASMHGGQCSSDTEWYFGLLSGIPVVGDIFHLFSSYCGI